VRRFSKLNLLSGLALLFLWPVGLEAVTIAGQEVQGGKMVEIRFPVAKYFQDIAAQFGNPRPETGRAVLTFPPGFDPSRRWPILIVTSTSDFHRTSPMDVEWYRPAADAEGWMILAADATIKPKSDSSPWRLAMLAAALEAVRKDWPQTAKWPVAFAGFSGGSKSKHRIDSGRKWYRQRINRKGDTPEEHAGRSRVCSCQQRKHAGGSAGKHTVRPRARSIHQRHRREEGII